MSEEVREDEVPATPGAQRQINELTHRVDRGLRAMRIVVAIIVVGLAFTGWQVKKAFDNQDDERLARIGASASITTFLCQRIDSVGNGVAALVRVSLRGVDPADLTPEQRVGYEEFLGYAEAQEQPPRCRELALKIATLTGADPEEIVITPIQLHDEEPQKPDRDGG